MSNEINRHAVTRRSALALAASGVALAGAGSALAQPAPAEKGPRVWLDMDQAALDAAYDQSKYAPNMQQVLKRYAANSEITRRRLGPPKRLTYGPAPVEGLDVFRTERPNAPIQVFIHGGAWRGGSAKDYAFPAETVVRAGAHYVVLDFSPVQDHGGNLVAMADQVRRAIAWVYRNAKDFGGDPERLYLSGHSSGGHLAGVAAATDWAKDYGVPADMVKGVVCISGLFDLKPVRLSARGSYVKLTDESEQAMSSQRHLAGISMPVVVVHGTYETPEFQRQSRDFAAALTAAGKPNAFIVAEGYNHFELMETLANPYGIVGRAVLDQMKLTAA